MRLFDTHSHCEDLSMLNEYPIWAKENQLYIMNTASNFVESKNAQLFSEKIPLCYFSVGVHPHEAQNFLANKEDFSQFKNCQKLQAIGELGLDYFYETSERKIQIEVFEEFLELALNWKLPAIIHCRDKDNEFSAYQDCYDILKNFHQQGGEFVLHCYAGNLHWLERFLELNCYMGVTGMVTFRKAENIRENLKHIPLDKLVIETDAPYLAPIPHRGKANNPGYVLHVAERVASELGYSVEEICEKTADNGFKLFNIKEQC